MYYQLIYIYNEIPFITLSLSGAALLYNIFSKLRRIFSIFKLYTLYTYYFTSGTSDDPASIPLPESDDSDLAEYEPGL
jgi:hypothetical protein